MTLALFASRDVADYMHTLHVHVARPIWRRTHQRSFQPVLRELENITLTLFVYLTMDTSPFQQQRRLGTVVAKLWGTWKRVKKTEQGGWTILMTMTNSVPPGGDRCLVLIDRKVGARFRSRSSGILTHCFSSKADAHELDRRFRQRDAS